MIKLVIASLLALLLLHFMLQGVEGAPGHLNFNCNATLDTGCFDAENHICVEVEGAAKCKIKAEKACMEDAGTTSCVPYSSCADGTCICDDGTATDGRCGGAAGITVSLVLMTATLVMSRFF